MIVPMVASLPRHGPCASAGRTLGAATSTLALAAPEASPAVSAC
jgi:hypothetical protein